MAKIASPMIALNNVSKSFVLHLQGGVVLPVVQGVSFSVNAGECVVLGGPSGAGKSSLIRMIHGNYGADRGSITIQDGARAIDLVSATPREVIDLRRRVMSYVSQFLRVIPRVSALDIVSRAAREAGLDEEAAKERARTLFRQLNVPERLWNLPPATFSGGEQQRVNIARSFAAPRPVLLLDEPTASLDQANRAVVIELIHQRKRQGAAILGIFHDGDVRDAVADRIVDVTQFKVA